MDQTITLALWRLPGAKYKIECYFWCTGGGQPPSVKGETDKDLIEALVGASLDEMRTFCCRSKAT